MDYSKYEINFSAPRLTRYLRAVKGDQNKAIQLYKLNIKLSQAFFLPLTVFEVTLRNKVCAVLNIYFQDSNWIMNQRNGFMSHPSLVRVNRKTRAIWSDDFLKSQVIKAETELSKRGLPVTAGRIIAEQSLAFWVSFFNPDYFRILKAAPVKAFSHLPKGKDRGDIANALEEIRRLRNRIFHHEPICFTSNHTIDVAYSLRVKHKIIEILDWMDPDICLEFTDVHEVDRVVARLRLL